MGLGKFFKKAAKVALPVIGTAVAGPVGGAIGGALGGAIGGGGFKGALKGGALGGAGGLLSSGIGLTGASGGLGSLFGSSGGAAGGAGAGSGFLSALKGGAGKILGTSVGSPLSGGAQGPTMGTGIKGLLGRSGGFSGILKKGAGVLLGGGNDGQGEGEDGQGIGGLFGGNDGGSLGLDLFSEYDRYKTLNNLKSISEDQLLPFSTLGANSAADYQRALDSGEIGGKFTPQDLQNDPGYQFNLQQGQQALDRANAAKGNLYSGAALKEALRFNQGLADQTYNTAFNRFLQEQENKRNALGTGIQAGVVPSYLLAQSRADVAANKQASRSGLFGGLLKGLKGFLG